MVRQGIIMSMRRHAHNGTSIVPHDQVQNPELIGPATPSVPRLASNLLGKLMMVVMIAAGAVGLTGFAVQVSRQDPELASAGQPGAGIIVRSEVVRIWLPKASGCAIATNKRKHI
jgi:hypothetical protein